MTSAPRFKKGQQVTRVTNWDRFGTFVYQQCEVISCGKKQMALVDVETGENLGNHFKPDGSCGTYEAMTRDEAIELGLQLAEEFLQRETEKYIELSERTEHGEGYCNAMRDNLNRLHEPRCESRNDVVERIRVAAGFKPTR